MSLVKSWKCKCNYKCKHSMQGWDLVTKRTFYYHRLQDSLGKVHPFINKRRRISENPLNSNDLEAAIEFQSIATITRTEIARRVSNLSNEERSIWCSCSTHCPGGRAVSLSTYYRHRALVNSFSNFKSNFGLCDSHDVNETMPLGGQGLEENGEHNHMQNEDSFSNGCDEQLLDVDDTELNKSENFSHVWAELIERIIELQNLWDENKLPINVQDKMLRLIFGDLGGSRVITGRCKSSLAKLLIQLPSTWEGDLGGIQVPACWDQLQNLLKGLGMVGAQRYRMCTGSHEAKHPPELFKPSNEDNFTGDVPKCICQGAQNSKKLKRDCLTCCEKCSICQKCRKSMASFDYIPIGPQLQLLTKSKTYCHEMLHLWRHKEFWQDGDAISGGRKVLDFWDGTKFQEVKDFWNPMAQYELPVVCSTPSCKKSYTTFPHEKRSKILEDGWDGDTKLYNFVCSDCKEEIVCKKNFCQGDPRNLALLIHWDGFQTSKTTQKSCGVVEIMVLNAGVNSSIDILPVLFIPQSCKKIIKNSGDVFGTFLRPLLDELESLYLNGVDVVYEYPIGQIFDNPQGHSKVCKVRAMVMMVTGDHPAQCKIGLIKNGGQEFCRRDMAQATLVKDGGTTISRYVYDRNRFQARFPPLKRRIDDMAAALIEAKRCCTQAEKEEIWKQSGLSGESILWRLYDLYGFDISLDLVFDAMHTLSLNVFKKYIGDLFKKADVALKREIDEAVKTLSTLVPDSIRHGRWPNSPSVYYESFKAEENQKFIQWCLPYILRITHGISSEMQILGLLLIDIAHSFYNYSRDHGWSMEDIKVVKTLLQSWRVRKEESFGANSSTLEHVAGSGELLDDVLRHGLHDRYWCYMFERLVKAYSRIKTNNLNDEASFVQFYLRRFFTKVFQAIQCDKDDLLPSDRFIAELHSAMSLPSKSSSINDSSEVCPSSHLDGLLIVSSIGKARLLWSNLLKYGKSEPCIKNLIFKGIAISKKRCVYREPTIEESIYLKKFWNIAEETFSFGALRTYQKVLFKGEVFKIGNDVVVEVDSTTSLSEQRGHWKARITSFFSMQFNGQVMLFFGGEYYNQCIIGDASSDQLLIDTVTRMSVLHRTPLPFTWDCIRPIHSLLHKFIPLPLPRSQKMIAYEVKDLKQRDQLLTKESCGNVPLWLECHDIVKVCFHSEGSKHFEHAVVRETIDERKVAKLAILKLDTSQARTWKVKKEEIMWRSWDSCVLLIKDWVVLKQKKTTTQGQLDRWIPIVWRSP